MPQNSFILAVDVGGTFTDFVLLNQATNAIIVGKMLTTPDPSEAVLVGVQRLLDEHEIAPQDIWQVIHGTTLVTNTLIERKGALTALLTTEGFRDALEIGNEGRYDIYDLGIVKSEPLVERRLRFGVPERMTARAAMLLHPLDEAAVKTICDVLRREAVESVAICLLHAYANSLHENRLAEIVRAELPDVSLCVSHQVSPAIREYQRTSTTVANAYVQPMTEVYLEHVRRGLLDADINAPLNVMLSSGGTTTIQTATDYPIRLVESGPSGGAIAGVYWGKQTGHEDILAFDMGGTTAKAVLTKDGELAITTQAEVAHVYRFKRGSGLPLLVPMIEMIEIGAGGGSIAHLSNLGLPAVGPESAGSTPGPVCYQNGGTEPTVTDADLTIGYLNPDYFANGTIKLDRSAAQDSFGKLAKSLDITTEKAAWSIHQLVNENMAAAARVHAAERGLDIQRYAMVSTGGAGPVHACGVAERLNIDTIIIPPIAGVGSAFGFLLAPTSFDFTRSYLSQLNEIDLAHLNDVLKQLEDDGQKIVMRAGVPFEQIRITRSVDMRYLGQGYEVRVPLETNELNQDALQALQGEFEEEYRRFYGMLCEGVPIQAVNWRVVISGPELEIDQLVLVGQSDAATHDQPYDTRPIIFNADVPPVETPVFRRDSLTTAFNAPGPVIIEEAECTTIVLPDWSVQVHESGCLLLIRGRGNKKE